MPSRLAEYSLGSLVVTIESSMLGSHCTSTVISPIYSDLQMQRARQSIGATFVSKVYDTAMYSLRSIFAAMYEQVTQSWIIMGTFPTAL